MTTRSTLITAIRHAIHTDGVTRPRPLLVATVTKRRAYSTLSRSMNLDVWPEASASLGYDDHGRKVVHLRSADAVGRFDWTETPVCRA